MAISGLLTILFGFALLATQTGTLGLLGYIGMGDLCLGMCIVIYSGSPRYEGRLRGLKWRNGQMIEPGGRDDVPYGEYLRTRTDAELDHIVDDEIGW